MNKNLIEALQLIDTLKGNEDINTIKSILNEAYAISDRALDAKILLSRLETNYYKKEKILKEAIIKEYHYLNEENAFPLDDEFLSRQYIRALYELSIVYKEFEKLPLLLELYEYIKSIKDVNPYGINDDIYALNYYFDRKDKLDDIKGVKDDTKMLINCLYEYERSNYDKALYYRNELIKIYPSLVDILDGNEEVIDREASKLLSRFAYYINRITSIIDFMKRGKYDA